VPRVTWGEESRPASAELVYLRATIAPPTPGPRWLPAPPTWSTEPWIAGASNGPSPSTQGEGGFWALFVELPPAAAGRALKLDGAALPVAWIAPPPPVTDAARAPRVDAGQEAIRALGDALRPLLSDPFNRWRVSIIAERFNAAALWGADHPGAMPDPALEALARQVEDRWRAAIERVRRADADRAAQLAATMTVVILSPQGALLPAWSLDESGEGLLRQRLLDPATSDSAAVESAQRWLHEQPPVVWVIDDSAPGPSLTRIGADGRDRSVPSRLALIGIAERNGSARVASAAAADVAARNATQLRPHQSATLTFEFPVEGLPSTAGVVRADGWSRPVVLLAEPVACRPPGLLAGPMWPQWSGPTWQASTPEIPAASESAIVLVQRSAAGDGWEAYIECRTIGAPRPEDAVRVWVGPYGAPSGVIEVRARDGAARSVRVMEDRWSALTSIPQSWIPPDEQLRVGVERVTPDGRRFSWPRPLMPEQKEPARAVVDLRTWGSMSAPARKE